MPDKIPACHRVSACCCQLKVPYSSCLGLSFGAMLLGPCAIPGCALIRSPLIFVSASLPSVGLRQRNLRRLARPFWSSHAHLVEDLTCLRLLHRPTLNCLEVPAQLTDTGNVHPAGGGAGHTHLQCARSIRIPGQPHFDHERSASGNDAPDQRHQHQPRHLPGESYLRDSAPRGHGHSRLHGQPRPCGHNPQPRGVESSLQVGQQAGILLFLSYHAELMGNGSL